MKKIDYHIHAEFSYDSSIQAEELIRRAIALNYDAIAFTEHLDLLPQELGWFGLKSLAKYREHIYSLQTKHPGIKIYCGLEIGDYHLVSEFAKPLISQFCFDLILGSVHFLSDKTNVAIPINRALKKSDIEDYYLQNLKLVSDCEIDVLAHLGVYKRFLSERPDETTSKAIIEDIFKVMIDRHIALEINFSSFRKVYQSLLPEPDILELYYSLGGRLISLGSDSHKLDHFNDSYHKLQLITQLDEFSLVTVN